MREESITERLFEMILPRFSSRTPNLVDVLTGLRPALVRELAAFAGADQRALRVIFSGMPWGDRATLAAYDVIALRRGSQSRGRVESVAPWAVELVRLAADVTLGDDTIDELRPLQKEVRALDPEEVDASDVVQFVKVVDELPPGIAVRSAADVISVASSSALETGWSRVFVRLLEEERGHVMQQFAIDVASDPHELEPVKRVLLAWSTEQLQLHRPDFATFHAPTDAGLEEAPDDALKRVPSS